MKPIYGETYPAYAYLAKKNVKIWIGLIENAMNASIFSPQYLEKSIESPHFSISASLKHHAVIGYILFSGTFRTPKIVLKIWTTRNLAL